MGLGQWQRMSMDSNSTKHQPHHQAQKKPCATCKALTSMMSFCECCLQPIFGTAMEPFWLFPCVCVDSNCFLCSIEVPHWKGCERIIVWLWVVSWKYRPSRSCGGYPCHQGDPRGPTSLSLERARQTWQEPLLQSRGSQVVWRIKELQTSSNESWFSLISSGLQEWKKWTTSSW